LRTARNQVIGDGGYVAVVVPGSVHVAIGEIDLGILRTAGVAGIHGSDRTNGRIGAVEILHGVNGSRLLAIVEGAGS
jgi:hypothetical protein